FNKQRYELVAKSQGLSAAGLDERLRQDYREREFRGAIADTSFVPKATLDGFIRLSQQTRDVSVVNLTPEAYLPRVKVTPEQVKAYYAAHASDFTTPEQARVESVEMSLDALAAKAQIPDEEVKRAYQEDVNAGKLGQKKERRASHIL